jgi:hypothetical protein
MCAREPRADHRARITRLVVIYIDTPRPVEQINRRDQ